MAARVICLCVLAASAAVASGRAFHDARPSAGFVDVASTSGLVHATWSGSEKKRHIRETLGQGACWTDFDRDDDPDLLLLNGAREVRAAYRPDDPLLHPWRFYRNTRGSFTDISAETRLDVRAWGIGCAAGDVDDDGFDDLFVTTAAGPDLLFRNRRDGTFEKVAFPDAPDTVLSSGAAFADFDRDGDLDLIVARYLDESSYSGSTDCRWKGVPVMCGPKGYRPLDAVLYVNGGGGRFTAPRVAGIAGHPGYGLGVVVFDADDDGDADIYIANDSSPSHLFLNRGNGTFEESGLAAGVALSSNGATQAGMGVDAGDLDGDGRVDLVKTNFSDDVSNFYRGEGGASFTDWADRAGLSQASFDKLGWAVVMEDFDLDTSLDLLVVNGHVYPEVDRFKSGTAYRQAPQLLLNDGAGRFAPAATGPGSPFAQPIAGRSAAAADFDRDGDMDVLVTRDGAPPLLLRNDLRAASTHWIAIRLQGRSPNREAIGARVEVQTRARRQVREVRRSRGYLSSGEARLLVGLGSEARADRVTVRWPDGGSKTLTNAAADREWRIDEGPPPARTPTRR
jgi:enediyne biosynthesis protein E4